MCMHVLIRKRRKLPHSNPVMPPSSQQEPAGMYNESFCPLRKQFCPYEGLTAARRPLRFSGCRKVLAPILATQTLFAHHSQVQNRKPIIASLNDNKDGQLFQACCCQVVLPMNELNAMWAINTQIWQSGAPCRNCKPATRSNIALNVQNGTEAGIQGAQGT